MRSSSRLLIGCWLALVALSMTSVQLVSSGTTLLLALLVLLAALAKAWLISDGFMELRHAPRLWRGLLLGWALVMVLGVLLSLLLTAAY
jgi:hypothetical protein